MIDKVTVSVDGYKLGNAKQTKKTPLYTIPWDAKNFKKGMHKISVDVKVKNIYLNYFHHCFLIFFCPNKY